MKLSYAIAGSYAVAFHGAPRGTVDIDLVVEWTEANVLGVQDTLNRLGLHSRQPLDARDVYQFRDEYIAKRGLIAWNFYNPNDQTEQVNLVIIYDLNVQEIVHLDVGEISVPVLSLNQLIQMKQASIRDQDRYDLELLLEIRKTKHLRESTR